MVADSLNNLMHYASLHPNIPASFAETIRRIEEGTLTVGKNVLSETAYISLTEYTPREAEGAEFEAHKDYIDVQIMLEGKEEFHCVPLEKIADLETQAYDAEKDFALYGGEAQTICILTPGQFVICFPEDGHKPMLVADKPCACRKAILKVHI